MPEHYEALSNTAKLLALRCRAIAMLVTKGGNVGDTVHRLVTLAIVAISILAYERHLAQTARACLVMAHFNRQVLVPLAGLATMHLGEKASVSMCVRGTRGPFSPCYATGRLAHSSWQVILLGW